MPFAVGGQEELTLVMARSRGGWTGGWKKRLAVDYSPINV
jgi:hypothetical protein